MTEQSVTDQSGWVAHAGAYRSFPQLTGTHKTDWLIVGGGFTGLAAARRLAELRPSDRIMIIDRKQLGQGATGRNSGFCVAMEVPGPGALESPADRADYIAQWNIHRAAAAEVQRLITELKIDCDFERQGYFFAVHDVDKFREIEARARGMVELGGEASVLEGDALRARLGIGFYRRGLWVGAGNGLLQPARFAKGLIDHLPPQIEVYEDTPAEKLVPRATGGASVMLENGQIDAARVLVGLNAFLPRLGMKEHYVFPISLTASLTRPLTADEESEIGQVKPWGVLCPIEGGATMRLTSDRRILIRNTAEFEPGGIDAAMLAKRRLRHEIGLRNRFPWLSPNAIEHTWSGHLSASRNKRFVFEALAPGLFVAGCYNGAGVARGTFLGKLMAEYATGGHSPMIDAVLAQERPNWVPTGIPFLIAAKIRLAHERRRARTEH